MVINQKVTGKAMPMVAGMALGVGTSMAITLAATAAWAYLIIAQKVSPDTVGYCAMIVLALSSAAGAWLSAAVIKHRWLPVCFGVGGIYYGVLLGITVLFFGGQFQGMFVTALMVLAGCGCVALLGIKRGNSSHKRAKKIPFPLSCTNRRNG